MQPESFPHLTPASQHPKRKLFLVIISVIGAMLVAAATVFILWLTQPKAVEPPKDTSSTIVPDLSKDYGACQLLTKDTIKTALGSKAADLQDGSNSGRLHYSAGVEGQYCSYDFTNNPANGTFKAEVSVYQGSADAQAIMALLADDTTKESLSLTNGDGFYSSNVDKVSQDSPEVQHFVLTFFSQEKQYTLSINQPRETVTFDDTSAKAALVTLANSVR